MLLYLIGVSRAGKDSVGKYFSELGFSRLAFADIPKIEYAKQINIDVNLLHNDQTKEIYRPGLTEFAENARKINENVWVEKLFENVDLQNNYVLTDFRRIPELKFALKNNIPFKICHVHRAVCDNDLETHKTINYCYVNNLINFHIHNYSTKENLYNESLNVYYNLKTQ